MTKIFIIIVITAIFYLSGDDQNKAEKYNEIVKIYNTIPRNQVTKIVAKLGDDATIEEVVREYNLK